MRGLNKGTYAGKELSGIRELHHKHQGGTAVICGSGTTLNDFDPKWVPKDWPIVAVNEAIGKLGKSATYWVLSDAPIVQQYSKKCPQQVTILAMHQATSSVESCNKKNKIYTTMSHAAVKSYNDGFNFFSRGTVLIGAIEMLRYMGIDRFFCFGLDCYRTKDAYYYDNRRPPMISEQKMFDFELVTGDPNVPPKVSVWVTSRLKHMIKKLEEARSSGIWDRIEIFCVNSPYSQQQSIEKISLDRFKEIRNEWRSEKRNAKSIDQQREEQGDTQDSQMVAQEDSGLLQ